jgi:hypothetical protein
MRGEKYYIIFLLFLLLAGIFVMIQIQFFQQKPGNTGNKLSTFSLTPTITVQVKQEPRVDSWQRYSNATYSVSFDIPKEWQQQDYAKFYPDGGTLLAFSPDPLPCDTCTYFQNGYFSVRIFNQQTDPVLYEAYLQKVQAVGKNKDYQVVAMGGEQGILAGSTITVAHQQWIYEFALDVNQGTMPVTDSKIFQKAVSSVAFDTLQFSQ